MKKILLVLALVVSVFTASARDAYSRDVNVLPKAAQAALANNFKAKVSHIKIDKDFGKISEYDVVLTDGSEISFDKDGNWKDIEVKRGSSVPSRFIPASIATYVKQNQKKASIVGIEKNKKGYEVELSNGVDMIFSSDGKFVRYDD